MQEIQKEQQFATLFVSNDLAALDLLTDWMAVIQHGVIFDYGAKDQVIRNPQVDYTKKLMAAVPVPDPKEPNGHSIGAKV
jgi:peptide/nickel transport system ATP-binding protein